MGNSLSWEDFKKLGNPSEEQEPLEDQEDQDIDYTVPVRVVLEKKGRGGKTVSIIRGLELYDDELNDLAKEIKKHCGGGGSVKNYEIIIQGDHRDKIISLLKGKGYKNVKKSGG